MQGTYGSPALRIFFQKLCGFHDLNIMFPGILGLASLLLPLGLDDQYKRLGPYRVVDHAPHALHLGLDRCIPHSAHDNMFPAQGVVVAHQYVLFRGGRGGLGQFIGQLARLQEGQEPVDILRKTLRILLADTLDPDQPLVLFFGGARVRQNGGSCRKS